MGTRYHRSIQILPGVRLNLSKSGMSISIGGAPFTFNFGERGKQITASLPGTGWSWIKRFNGRGSGRDRSDER